MSRANSEKMVKIGVHLREVITKLKPLCDFFGPLCRYVEWLQGRFLVNLRSASVLYCIWLDTKFS